MEFNKPPLTFEQQLDRLIERGMVVPDRPEAVHYLGHLNYYRLAAYWLPFEQNHATHAFIPGTGFPDVLDLYVFDRELRLLVLDAIERTEVSIRTGWAYHLANRYGAHAHLERDLFKASRKGWDYDRQFALLQEEVHRSHETFIQHLRKTYDEVLPPVWASVEIMTFGQLSKWYSNLRHGRDRNAIAHTYDLDEVNLTSFLHHLTIVRNICAHHSRLWNREFTFRFKVPNRRPKELLSSFNRSSERKLYNTLVLLAWMMDCTSPNHHWKARLSVLLEQHGIETPAMGFPEHWQELPIWRDG